MNIKSLINVLSGLLAFLGLTFMVPLLVSLMLGDGQWKFFLIPAASSIGVGYLVNRITKGNHKISLREGFATVTFGWILFAIVGCTPFIISGVIGGFIDAFFETMSGFTTTGSTILTDVEVLAPSLLFWRSFTQWLGGMGIIVLTLAVLPILGVEGTQLFHAEAPGPTRDQASTRVKDTAKILWILYTSLTLILAVLLTVCGMSFFDAINHAFNTLSTGGFSTYNASIGHFSGATIQWLVTFFMFLGGINFTLHINFLRGDTKSYFKSEELKVYLLLLTITIVSISLATYNGSLEETFRYVSFQVISISTTTGFGTYDYELWPFFAQVILIILMICGGNAGSTSGGSKIIRVIYVIKSIGNFLGHLIHPKQVKRVKIDNRPIVKEVSRSIFNFFTINAFIVAISTLVLSSCGLDPLSAVTSVIACVANIGPGLGSVGPTDNFAHIHDFGKIWLSMCMLIGRLEFFTVLVLVLPSSWKK